MVLFVYIYVSDLWPPFYGKGNFKSARGGRRFEKRARAQEIYPERGSWSTPPPRKDLSAQNEYQGVNMCVW